MKAVVTGATGFLGGHVTKLLAERGDDVRVTYRNPERLKHLKGVKVRRAKADVLDYKAMRRAMKGADVLFHTVGFVGSNPAELVWRMNAHAPVVAVEAAAAEGLKRVVLTSTISAIGPTTNGQPASELTDLPARLARPGLPGLQARGRARGARGRRAPRHRGRGRQPRLPARRADRPRPARRDLHADGRQLPAPPAARRDRRADELRRRRGRRPGPPAGGRQGRPPGSATSSAART